HFKMDYIEVEFTINPRQPATDILTTALCDIGFDSFVETGQGFCAYIPLSLFSEEELKRQILLDPAEFNISYTSRSIPAQNWNKAWESNFDPVVINEQCVIRAPFHAPMPQYRHEIIIEPKMSFGTGHHET